MSIVILIGIAALIALALSYIFRPKKPELAYSGIVIADLPPIAPAPSRNKNGTFAKGSKPLAGRGPDGKFVKRETTPFPTPIPNPPVHHSSRPVEQSDYVPAFIAPSYDPTPDILDVAIAGAAAAAIFDPTPDFGSNSCDNSGSFDVGGGGDFGGGGAGDSW